MEEPRCRELISWGGGWGVRGVFVWVYLLSGVVPRDRKSGEYVNLGMGRYLL